MEFSHPIRKIFEDDFLLAIDKPPGLVVDPAEIDFGIKLPRGGIVHRLDKDTSGILLVAKTQAALENLQAQFKEREVKKEYLALAHGLVEQPVKVEGAIGRNPGDREKFTVMPDGKEAVTEFQPVSNFQFSPASLREAGRAILNFQSIFNDYNKIQMRKLERMRYNQFTLLRCFPKTGRTHQIRVHLKYISHSIVADEKYAGRKMYRLDKRWCPRIFLHAAKIGFKHPASGEWMELASELPEDLRETLEKLDE